MKHVTEQAYNPPHVYYADKRGRFMCSNLTPKTLRKLLKLYPQLQEAFDGS